MPEETFAPRPWCWRAAASRRTANGVRAISGPAGTWRRCAAPASTPATASAWRSTSARSPTANGRAATPAPGSATPATSAASRRAQRLPPQLSLRHRRQRGRQALSRRGRRFPQLHLREIRPRMLQQPGGYAWQVFDAQAKPLMRDEYKLRGATKVTADTLEELVTRMQDVDTAQFLKTVLSTTRRSRARCRSIPTSRTAGARLGWRSTSRTGQRARAAAVRGLLGRLRHHLHVRRGEDRHRRRACSTSRTRRCRASMPPARWSAAFFISIIRARQD